jgi:Ca-activated chloride channel family protein
MSAIVNRPYLPEGGGGINCELVIEPDEQEEEAQRHIALCVDSSGSMAYSKMDQVRDATKLVFGVLNDQDYLSIITFDDEIEVIMDGIKWKNIERDEAENMLEEITTGGGTDIYNGLEEAHESLNELRGGENVSKRILLLSDGRDLRAKAPDFEPLAKDIADDGISVYAAGIGTNYGKDVIRTVGQQSQGRWAHVEQPTDIRSFFGDVVQEASSVLANNPELVLDPIEGCEIGMAFRRLPQVQKVNLEYESGSVIVGLPDLQDRERQEVVLKMDAPRGTIGEETAITTATLRDDTGEEITSCDITVTYSDDEEELSQHNRDVTVAYHDTDLRTRIAQADSSQELDEVKEEIEETAVITGEEDIADALRENVTRIEEGDEGEARKVQENTTVVFEENRFD